MKTMLKSPSAVCTYENDPVNKYQLKLCYYAIGKDQWNRISRL